ncbi:hypothetical protein [Actinacidiphila sp. ITFR-21]|uniref:hypothetical protein n=1 Tax=Actinacidiphila sp. ITFR-21 TaxID=3075199 RepID=UPI002889E6A5|nr:hypothetical protein [Streptomyces sp. ITFR-21]WNI14797.1 hypothetical protein RLT57_04100 [Streptomyces sp. ITFR-21]
MQPSAGPALPHTRSRTVHWIATAAAVGVLVGAVALVEPADASQSGAQAARDRPPTGPVAAPDPAAVTYPLDCPPGVRTDVVSAVSGDLDGDGRPETVVVVRCHADVGTPPSGVFVLGAAPSGGAPRIVVTLVRPRDDRQVSDFRLEGRTVRATVLGFSGDDTPRCCPDLRRTYAWEWRGDRYVALPGPAANSV